MKVLILIAAITFSGFSCFSQSDSLTNTTTYAERTDALVEKYSRELQLEKKQGSQLAVIIQKRWKNIEKFKSNNLPVDWKEVNQKTLVDIRRILSRGQLEILTILITEQKRDRDEYMRRNPGFTYNEDDMLMDIYN